jgi:hypothetical protein
MSESHGIAPGKPNKPYREFRSFSQAPGFSDMVVKAADWSEVNNAFVVNDAIPRPRAEDATRWHAIYMTKIEG